MLSLRKRARDCLPGGCYRSMTQSLRFTNAPHGSFSVLFAIFFHSEMRTFASSFANTCRRVFLAMHNPFAKTPRGAQLHIAFSPFGSEGKNPHAAHVCARLRSHRLRDAGCCTSPGLFHAHATSLLSANCIRASCVPLQPACGTRSE